MVNPWTVISPQKRLSQMRPIHNTVDWSMAIGMWDANRALLIRWNVTETSQMGNPVSRSHPTWFVLPSDLWDVVLGKISEPNRTGAIQWLNDGDWSDWTDPLSI